MTSAALPGQDGQGGPGQSLGALDIDRKNLIPILGLRSGQQGVADDASRMNDRIDPTAARQDLFDRCRTGIVPGYVQSHGFHPGRQGRQGCAVPARKNPVPGPSQFSNQRLPQAPGGPAD